MGSLFTVRAFSRTVGGPFTSREVFVSMYVLFMSMYMLFLSVYMLFLFHVLCVVPYPPAKSMFNWNSPAFRHVAVVPGTCSPPRRFEGGGAFVGWVWGKHLAGQHLLEGEYTASSSGYFEETARQQGLEALFTVTASSEKSMATRPRSSLIYPVGRVDAYGLEMTRKIMTVRA